MPAALSSITPAVAPTRFSQALLVSSRSGFVLAAALDRACALGLVSTRALFALAADDCRIDNIRLAPLDQFESATAHNMRLNWRSALDDGPEPHKHRGATTTRGRKFKGKKM